MSSLSGRLATTRRASASDILAYATGDGVNSLIVNGMGFAMLCYTEALHVEYRSAALILAVATLWSVIADPIMGHISDNTRSRFGRRHPYMLMGGIAAVACFFFAWSVPRTFQAPHLLIVYLLVINLLLRTALSIFAVPHAALGFEISTEYTQRTTLQGVRTGFTMLINLVGPAMAWSVFFRSRDGVESMRVASNYVEMGRAFSIAALFFVLLVVLVTKKYVVDTRCDQSRVGNRPGVMLKEIRGIVLDEWPRKVFLFMGMVFIGMALVASLQMYVFVHVMHLSSLQRTLVHGATIAACGMGGLISPVLVRRTDKHLAVARATGLTVAASIGLLMLQLPAWGLSRGPACADPASTSPGNPAPWGGLVLFMALQSVYWMGSGMITPIATSMIADASEVCRYRTGVLKDGGYSAVLSAVTKLAMSLGVLFSGACLSWIGFVPDCQTQTDQAVTLLAVVTFAGGAVFPLTAMLTLWKYPFTRNYMLHIQREMAAGRSHDGSSLCLVPPAAQ